MVETTRWLVRMQNMHLHSLIALFLFFRYCAVLVLWDCDRVGVMVITSITGTDPAAVDVLTIDNAFFKFVTIVLLAPLLETFLLQYLPFVWLAKSLRPGYIILLSALVFSLLHHYSIVYMISAFSAGMLYAIAYYLRSKTNPFLTVFAIHAGYNGVVFMWNSF